MMPDVVMATSKAGSAAEDEEITVNNNKNDDNNNNQDNVYDADIMTESHCDSSPGSRDECRTASDGCQPLDQAVGLEPLARLLAARKLYPPSPFNITQSES